VRAVAEGASLDGAARVLAILLAVHLVLLQPVVGTWSHQRFRRAEPDPGARLRRYRRTAAVEWTLAAVSLALVAAAPGLDLADIGVRWPRPSAYTVVGAVGLALSVGLLLGLRRRIDRGAQVVAPAEVTALLPGLSPWRLVLVSALAFAVAHTYQGVAGMLTAAVLGGSLAVVYLGSGSLLLPVLYHVLVDLRVLVLAVDRPRHRHRAAPDGRDAG